eukprot:CAMPEP_0172770858 /NCGR_PEP_ID=MMETSP1074-20121228/189504_1 /TAXON_ID=2916 /ORGANISM="Ceratium fusus, Strain PA161109" /LENGTH=76 /DNA_ID=CAMNT_0013606695 /DNA_START=91 /DNA_END=321 /DNA_ORIENTATION=-
MIFYFNFDIIKWFWEKFLAVELSLPLQFVYGVSIMSQVVCAIIVAASGILNGLDLRKHCKKSSRRRENQWEIEDNF